MTPEPETGSHLEPYQEAPPVGEEIHLPGPTLLPLITAVGITLIVIGTTINWIYCIVGGVITIVAIVEHSFRTIGPCLANA